MDNLPISEAMFGVLILVAIITGSYVIVRFLSSKDWGTFGRAAATGAITSAICLVLVIIFGELKAYFLMWVAYWFFTGFVGGLFLELLMKIIQKVRS